MTGAGKRAVVAGTSRSDLCTAIKSCDHGFRVPVPAGLMDGAKHTVHAYGLAVVGAAANAELGASPKTFECPVPKPPLTVAAGVKRLVVVTEGT
jgi:hypothetical protein